MDDDPDYQLSLSRESKLAKDISSSLLEGAVSATLVRHHVMRAQINMALVDDLSLIHILTLPTIYSV